MRDNKILGRFGLVFLFLFGAQSIVYTQIVPYLVELGYDSTERGLLLSFFALVVIVCQIYAGFLCDKYGKVKLAILISLFLGSAASIGFYGFGGTNLIYHMLILSIMAGLLRVSATIGELWVFETESVSRDFGFVRSFGSLGWAIAASISGVVALQMDYIWLGYISMIMAIITFLLMRKAPEANLEIKETINYKDGLKLFKIKDFRVVLYVFFLLYYVYNSEGILIPDLITKLGGDGETLGIRQALMAVSELPLFFISGRLILKYGGKKLMLFSSFIYGVKILLFAFTPNIAMLLGLTLLQSVTFPLMLVGLRDMVYHIVPIDMSGTSQMLANSLTNGVSSVLSPLITGVLLNYVGVQHIFAIYSILVFVSFLITFTYKGVKMGPKKGNT